MKMVLVFTFRTVMLMVMIVCGCTGTTERTIVALAQERTCSVEDIVRACDASGQCGGCRTVIDQIVSDHQHEPDKTHRARDCDMIAPHEG